MYLLYLTMKTPNGIFTLCILLYALITAVICPRLIKNGKTAHAYLLCSLPLIGAGIHFGIYGRVTLELF